MFNDYCRTLCPVCQENVLLKIFRLHMEKDEVHLEFKNVIEEQVYTTLLHATQLKNVNNYVYFNWDYYLQTKYKVTQMDKKNYLDVTAYLKANNLSLSLKNIANNMVKLDSKYIVSKLLLNIIRIVQNSIY